MAVQQQGVFSTEQYCKKLTLCYDVMCIAGEVMQGERDALLKLIQSLRHEYEAVQAAKMGQESELLGLKVHPCPAHDMLQHPCMPGYDI